MIGFLTSASTPFEGRKALSPPPSNYLGLFWQGKKLSFFLATMEQNITRVNLFYLTR
jgi:hypothetical protein